MIGSRSIGLPIGRTGGFVPLLLLAALVLPPSPLAAQEPDARPGIAVFPFDNNYVGSNREDFDGLEGGLQQMMITELSQNSGLRVVERSELRSLLDEQDLGASGRVDPSTAARVGRVVGARYVIMGQYVDIFGDVRMDARVVDTETSEIIRTEQVRADRSDLYQMLVDLASQVVAGVNLPALPVEVRETRRSREIPSEAITLFSRAQLAADGGQTDRAIQLYRQAAERFPDLTEAREALRQLGG
jgi:TolB-like protein